MKANDKKLLDLLLQDKIIGQNEYTEIRELAEKQGRSVVGILEGRDVDKEKVVKYRARAVGMPYKNLLDKKSNSETLEIIPPKVAENYKIICFGQEGDEIKVGMVNPYNSKAVEAVNFLAQSKNLKPDYYLISQASFDKFFKQYRNLESEVSSALEVQSDKEKQESGGLSFAEEDVESIESGEENVEAAPVAKIVS